MSTTINIAERYFELSNLSDMDSIESMLTDSSTYSSVNTGVYLGRSQIMTMMRSFHSVFESLTWTIDSIIEIRPGVAHIEFSLISLSKHGDLKASTGNEYVLSFDGMLQHIEVRN